MTIGFGMIDPVLNEPRHPWYQKRNHVRIPKIAESKKYLDAAFIPGAGAVTESLFGDTVPTGLAAPDGNPYMLGTVFTVGVTGMITHVRVYRSPALVDSSCPIAIYANNNPVSVAYDENAVFTGAGWNDIPLPTPLAVTPGVHYMAAYFNATGAYGYTSHMFDSAVVNGDLTALSDAAASGNGKFKQINIPSLPDTSFNATWYGTDVLFIPNSGAVV